MILLKFVNLMDITPVNKLVMIVVFVLNKIHVFVLMELANVQSISFIDKNKRKTKKNLNYLEKTKDYKNDFD